MDVNKMVIAASMDNKTVIKNSSDLEKLLEEIERWDEKEAETIPQLDRHKTIRRSKTEKAKTIDLSYNEHNKIDTTYLQDVIANCKDEFIKIRIPPSSVHSDIVAVSMCDNDSAECRRRERPKTIAEYLV